MSGVTDTVFFGLVHDFLKVHLPSQRGCSVHTIRAYQSALNAMLHFVKTDKGIGLNEVAFEMIDSVMISAFLDSIEMNGCSVSTRNHRLNCIRSFYAYAAKMNPIAVVHQAEIYKVPQKKAVTPTAINYMSENAIKALLEQPDAKTKKGLRDKFLMLLMYDTGARVQEVLGIRVCDIHLGKTPTVTLIHTKGSKTRTVPLMRQTVEFYGAYRKAYHSDKSDSSACYLFYVPMRGEDLKMDDSTVRKFMASYGLAAKAVCPEVPSKVHPHLLRHSRAMHLYQHGMDLLLVSQWLGHAHLDTTLIYAHADTEHKRKAIEKSTPQDSPLRNSRDSMRYTVNDEETLKKLYGLS